MTTPPRPNIDADSEAWWTCVREHTLSVNACGSCGSNSLYPRPFCPHCWSQEVALTPASGRARLYTWSVVHQKPTDDDPRTSYIVAMVDLEEGPRLMTTIEECPVEDLRDGLDLTVAFREDDDGFVVPVFRPA